MKTASIYQDLEFNENKPAIKAILETDFTKEIRILMRENQEMKEHQTPFPIVVELLEGEIIFGVEGQNYEVKKGDFKGAYKEAKQTKQDVTRAYPKYKEGGK